MLFVDGGANRVGINTGSPRELLDITSTSGDARIMIDAPSGSDAEIKFYNAGVSQFTIGHDDGTDNFVIGTTNVDTDLVNINKSGNVGIGTSSLTGGNTILNLSRTGSGVGCNMQFANSHNGAFYVGLAGDTSGNVILHSGDSTANMLFATNNTERMRIDSSGDLNLVNAGLSSFNFTTDGSLDYARITGGKSGSGIGELQFWTYSGGISRAATIDKDGNLLIGGTDTDPSNNSAGAGLTAIGAAGYIAIARPANTVALFNRIGSGGTEDGDVIDIRRNGATAGNIGTTAGTLHLVSQASELYVGTSGTVESFFDAPGGVAFSTFTSFDGLTDLGRSNARFDDVYATNGTIQTSDRNEKQDIEELSDAEQRVAVAAKGLLRKFRWKSAVAKKGDEARTHFGIIAQDLQDAFTAEGLDAGDYAMFTSNTWWETQTDVGAVEAVEGVEFVQAVEASDAVYDEDGELVSEAVEAVEGVEAVEAVMAKDAYTRTDTFDTLAEAPEDATERTRLGVRYPELLAFIISAI